MLQSQIIQENTASIRLCESCGFRKVGYGERINRDALGVWHNLVLVERRSKNFEGNVNLCGCGKSALLKWKIGLLKKYSPYAIFSHTGCIIVN